MLSALSNYVNPKSLLCFLKAMWHGTSFQISLTSGLLLSKRENFLKYEIRLLGISYMGLLVTLNESIETTYLK